MWLFEKHSRFLRIDQFAAFLDPGEDCFVFDAESNIGYQDFEDKLATVKSELRTVLAECPGQPFVRTPDSGHRAARLLAFVRRGDQ